MAYHYFEVVKKAFKASFETAFLGRRGVAESESNLLLCERNHNGLNF
jgi:hypothetical protein